MLVNKKTSSSKGTYAFETLYPKCYAHVVTTNYHEMPIKKPIIILKQAMSCNGYLDNKEPKLFSNSEDRIAVQKLRASVDAVLVGANTIRNDDPSLLIREQEFVLDRETKGLSSQPIRVVIGGKNSLSPNSKVFSDKLGSTVLFHSKGNALGLNNEFLIQKEYLNETLDLVSMLESLFEMGIGSLLVEGGANIAAQFLKYNLVDIVRFAYAPVMIENVNATRLLLEEGFQIKNIKPKLENLGSMYAVWYCLTERGSSWAML